MLRVRRLVVVGILAGLATTSACTRATTESQICEKQWSENSTTAMPREVRGDPVASSMWSERYVNRCEN